MTRLWQGRGAFWQGRGAFWPRRAVFWQGGSAFWQDRTARERLLIALLAAVGLACLLVLAVWQPLRQHRATLTGDIARHARAATTLAALPAGQAAPVPADTPLPGIITDTAARLGLTIRRLQPSASAANITLEDAPFDAVALWIDTLERDHALRIASLTITRRPQPGLVAVTLTVER